MAENTPEPPHPLHASEKPNTEVLALLFEHRDFKPSFDYLIKQLDSAPHEIGADLEMYIERGIVYYHDEDVPRYSHKAAHKNGAERNIEDSVIEKSGG